MKTFITMVLATGLLPATAATAQTSVPAPRLEPRPGLRVDANYLAGVWSDREDCAQGIRFLRDGRFINPDGTSGTWRLDGDRLNLAASRTISIRLVPRGPDETIVVQANGTLGYSRRCAGS